MVRLLLYYKSVKKQSFEQLPFSDRMEKGKGFRHDSYSTIIDEHARCPSFDNVLYLCHTM